MKTPDQLANLAAVACCEGAHHARGMCVPCASNLIAEAVAAEREACARLAEVRGAPGVAKAIRARLK